MYPEEGVFYLKGKGGGGRSVFLLGIYREDYV